MMNDERSMTNFDCFSAPYFHNKRRAPPSDYKWYHCSTWGAPWIRMSNVACWTMNYGSWKFVSENRRFEIKFFKKKDEWCIKDIGYSTKKLEHWMIDNAFIKNPCARQTTQIACLKTGYRWQKINFGIFTGKGSMSNVGWRKTNDEARTMH